MTRDRDVPLWEQLATRCVHFNGIMNKACDAGITYDDLVAGPRLPYRRELPCLKEHPTDETRTALCPKAEYLTEEQARVKADESLEHTRKWLEDMAKGICPTHQQPFTKRQVGRCVYANPCGCRLYQGRI